MNYDRDIQYRRRAMPHGHLRDRTARSTYSLNDAVKTGLKLGEYALDAYNAASWLGRASRESNWWTKRVSVPVWKTMSDWERARGIQNKDRRIWPEWVNEKSRQALSKGLKYAEKLVLCVCNKHCSTPHNNRCSSMPFPCR